MMHLDVKDKILTVLENKVDIESVRPLAD
jgi:hypothetical protein